MTPFDRCGPDAAAVLDDAITRAHAAGHPHVGTEHVLVALAARPDLLPVTVAAVLPPCPHLENHLAASPGQPSTADALASIGVDLHAIRVAARRTFGDSAVDQLARRRVRQSWQPWRRPSRRCTALLADALRVSPRLKRVLADAAARAGPGRVTPLALLAAILDCPDARATLILEESGVDVAHLRSLLSA